MKAIGYYCQYTVDDQKYLYTAFNYDGSLSGFQNPPIRDYEMREWIDSVTGKPGDMIPHDRWVSSMRVTSECHDTSVGPKFRKDNNPKNISTKGKKRRVI